jgi:hypothetical protein
MLGLFRLPYQMLLGSKAVPIWQVIGSREVANRYAALRDQDRWAAHG